MNKYISRKTKFLSLLVLLFAGCSSGNSTATQPGEPEPPATVIATQASPTSNPSLPSTLQPIPSPIIYGPDDFPESFNPLTGQRVSDPAQLDFPALLLSISHFPPAARPQAGLSFTPIVYEYYITEGSTRHLAVLYGEFPTPEIPLHGNCEGRPEPMTQSNSIIGNRLWHDENQNGTQDPREGGV